MIVMVNSHTHAGCKYMPWGKFRGGPCSRIISDESAKQGGMPTLCGIWRRASCTWEKVNTHEQQHLDHKSHGLWHADAWYTSHTRLFSCDTHSKDILSCSGLTYSCRRYRAECTTCSYGISSSATLVLIRHGHGSSMVKRMSRRTSINGLTAQASIMRSQDDEDSRKMYENRFAIKGNHL